VTSDITDNNNPDFTFNFTKFHLKYNSYFNNTRPVISNEFLTWLIGFTEGDGSFIVLGRGSLQFVITQGEKDEQVLQMIKETLGFGNVIKQNTTKYRYVVQDKKGLELIVSLFNGNLILPSRKIGFLTFLRAYNELVSTGRIVLDKQIPIFTNILPGLTNGWLAGFTDSEGCFTCSILSTSNAYRIRFIVTQKGEVNLPILNHLIILFNCGAIEAHSIKDVYSYVVVGTTACYNILPYFDTYTLRSKKRNSYTLWKEVHVRISNREHLNPQLRPLLKEMASKINNTVR
jgi:hypothetical protein